MTGFDILATDYDGTLAQHGTVEGPTLQALRRLREAGGKTLLVTGRELADLQRIFSAGLNLFDGVVAENGALIYEPATEKLKTLCPPPSREFVDALRAQGVTPLFVGETIVATQETFQTVVAKVIQAMGLPLQIILNKGSAMVLPANVNKATGLRTTLQDRGWAASRVIAIGDGENDHDLLAAAGFGAAVSNAVPALKKRAQYVTRASHGAGVVELIELWLAGKLPISGTAKSPAVTL